MKYSTLSSIMLWVSVVMFVCTVSLQAVLWQLRLDLILLSVVWLLMAYIWKIVRDIWLSLEWRSLDV